MIDNFIKGPMTSLLGFGVMGVAAYFWFTDAMTDMQAGASGIVGFALLFMRDKLPEFITKLFNKKLDK